MLGPEPFLSATEVDDFYVFGGGRAKYHLVTQCPTNNTLEA